jgi:hypothetical protein
MTNPSPHGRRFGQRGHAGRTLADTGDLKRIDAAEKKAMTPLDAEK